MKYKFEIKKENRSIIWKILLVMIYFSFYAVSIRLFMTYFPFINKELIIVVGVLALGQLDVAPAVIVPALCVGDFHVLRPCAVIRTCDANRCLTGFANVAQIHQASGHQAVHARFRRIDGKGHSTGTGDPDEALSGVARILIIVHLCRNSCIAGQSQVLALRGEQRFICRH